MKITKKSIKANYAAKQKRRIVAADEDAIVDWYNDYENHPLDALYHQALDELNVWAEPSTQGRRGSVFYYNDSDDGGVSYQTDFSDECDFMDTLGYQYVDDENPNDTNYIEAIKKFITKHIYDDAVDDVNYESNDYIYTGEEIPYKLRNHIESITIAEGVKSIGDYAFEYCGYLTSVTIPDSVTSIGKYSFNGCSSLTSMTIGNGVTSIGGRAFSGCSALDSISVSNGNIKYHSDGNCLIETENKKLIAGCKNSVIPDDGSVTTIGDHAFYGCSSLTSINIPDSVTSISHAAFAHCNALTRVTIPDSVTSIGEYMFYFSDNVTIRTNNPIAIEYAEKEGIPVVPLDDSLVTL